MKAVWVIFWKELVDTLRDRRTLAMMLLVPLVLVPLVVGMVTQLQARLVLSARAPLIRVALVNGDEAPGLLSFLRSQPDLRVETRVPVGGIPSLIRRDSLDAAFLVQQGFGEQIASLKSGGIELVYEDDINTEVNRQRLRELVRGYRDELLGARLDEMGIGASALELIELEERDVRRRRLILGQILGGILPYFFIIFCYLGAMYPAIDLAAGEKERATMETLLTTPTTRLQIVVGKFGVVVLCGLASALTSILGLYVGLAFIRNAPPELLDSLHSVLQPGRVILLALLIVPLSMCFAGLMLSFSIFARSFKEAQSILSPLAIVTVLPAVVGLLPGVSLTPKTALIPMMNVSVAMREIISGTVRPLSLLLVFASLVCMAVLCLYLCALYFRREDVIFRT